MQTELSEILEYYPEVTGIHPACLAVPEIGHDDKIKLNVSIARDGLRHEIILTEDGLLIDGRNRLVACFEGKVEPRFRRVSIDPWQVAYAENIARRHLDTKQKAVFGYAWKEHESTEARLRQGTRTDIPETLPGSYATASTQGFADSRDKVGERVGVSGKSIDKIGVVAEFAPEKLTDDSSLEEAFREAAKRKKSKQADPVEKPVVVAVKETTMITTAKGVESQIAMPSNPVFNATNDSVDWANWTWNPVTGCEHGCKFCYAREIANSQRMAAVYPNKFEPTYHPYRLAAPKNTKHKQTDDDRDGRVFVCSMADLFGKWVPSAWIKSVFDACLESPEWEYLFLTKWPARYAQMPLLKKAWYGASVIQQSDVSRIEKSMSAFETDCVKWISMEPMLGPVVFNDLSWCDLVVIGAQTSTTQPEGFVAEFAPKFDWIVDVVNQCREAGVPYYLKANLGLQRPGMDLPKSGPRRR